MAGSTLETRLEQHYHKLSRPIFILRTKGLLSMQDTNQAEIDPLSENADAENRDYVEIAALAYQLWKDRGCPLGSPEADWFQAESDWKARETSGQAAAAVA
jgi:hypothetical protein